MSFILDALKRSESERQQQSGAEFANVPTSTAKPGRNYWLWLLGGLLAVNLAVLTGILLRPASAPEAAVAPAMPPARPGDAANTTPANDGRAREVFSEQVAAARRRFPEPADLEPAAGSPADPPTVEMPAVAADAGRIPTLDELRLEGTTELPELRIDIHVYSEDPGERFVFINMNKLRERSTLPEGPVVREIRPDGVVLDYRGRSFLLSQE